MMRSTNSARSQRRLRFFGGSACNCDRKLLRWRGVRCACGARVRRDLGRHLIYGRFFVEWFVDRCFVDRDFVVDGRRVDGHRRRDYGRNRDLRSLHSVGQGHRNGGRDGGRHGREGATSGGGAGLFAASSLRRSSSPQPLVGGSAAARLNFAVVLGVCLVTRSGHCDHPRACARAAGTRSPPRPLPRRASRIRVRRAQ